MPRTRLTRRAGPRRKLVWARRVIAVTNVPAALPAFSAPTRVDLLSEFVTAYGAALIGCTIVRIRGFLQVSETAAGNGALVRAGFYIGDANDIVRGPNANDNAFDSNSVGKDFFGFEPFQAPGPGAQDNTALGSETVARLIDIRAMRKLEEVSQRLVLDVSTSSGTANQVIMNGDLSVLVMLP